MFSIARLLLLLLCFDLPSHLTFPPTLICVSDSNVRDMIIM